MAAKNKGGRPPMYKTAAEMQKVIDAYFEDCRGKMLTIKDRETGEDKPVLDKHGQPIWVDVKPPTVTGLALALGFSGRQALLNYQVKDEFMDTVTRAKSRVEEYAESRLFDKDGVNGAKFSLANNFKDWREKQEIDQTVSGKDGGPVQIDMSGLSIDELKKLAEKL